MIRSLSILLFFSLFAFSFTMISDAHAATLEEIIKLTASDAAAGDRFGLPVSISGDTAIVGAQGDGDAGANSGSAYIFVKNGTTWTQVAKLTASDAAADDSFGVSVLISGDTAIVGAFFDDDAGANSGSAYVFVKPGAGWSGSLNEDAKLTASDAAAGDIFGFSVSISGDTAIVGAIFDDNAVANSGSAYVFVKPGAGWSGSLNEDAKLTASDDAAGDFFGYSVSISGDTAIVGNRLDDNAVANSGSAYVFVKPGAGWSGSLNEDAKLTASDAAAGDELGTSVSISGDTAIVGAIGDDDAGASSGSAYVFVKPGAGWSGSLNEDAKLTASDGAVNDLFGFSVSISGDKAIVGAFQADNVAVNSGSAYVFVKPGAGWSGSLNEDQKLTASDAAASDNFGISVSIFGDTAIVGASGDSVAGSSTGSAYVFSVVAECNGLSATIIGTAGNDFIEGTSGDDVIAGLDGDDYILGKGGNDTICGGLGNDLIKGGNGNDTIFGDDGNDLIIGGGDNDTLSGGSGSDTINGKSGDDTINGNGGKDHLMGGSGIDVIKGNAGDDLISGGAGDDTLNGNGGTDTCDNSQGTDTLSNCELSE